MKESIEVIVTREDIEKGVPESDELCPVALAVKRLFGFDWVYVGIGGCFIDIDNSEGKRFSLPIEARDFIRDFDNGKEVNPFIFMALAESTFNISL